MKFTFFLMKKWIFEISSTIRFQKGQKKYHGKVERISPDKVSGPDEAWLKRYAGERGQKNDENLMIFLFFF